MVKDQVIRWIPLPELEGTYALYKLGGREGELIITLANKNDSKTLVEIIPNGLLIGYRKTVEASLVVNEGSFFKVINSTFVEFLVEESYTVYLGSDFQHYLFITPESKIEVVCGREPSVRIITCE